jgi:hypothetical protein
MKQIKLTQNQWALVDDEDFDWLNQWKWCATWSKTNNLFYVKRSLTVAPGKQRSLLLHRVLLGLTWGDGLQIDHIDHNPLNNQRRNLRIVTAAENQANRRALKLYRNNKIGHSGISWDKRRKKWRVSIKQQGILWQKRYKFLGDAIRGEQAQRAIFQAQVLHV